MGEPSRCEGCELWVNKPHESLAECLTYLRLIMTAELAAARGEVTSAMAIYKYERERTGELERQIGALQAEITQLKGRLGES
jgi:uncharacterized small protein (DUF1192 family)